MIDVGDREINNKLAVSAPTIYHYTSSDVLPVFFDENADLYCTNSKCLNDPTELLVGTFHFVDYIKANGWLDEGHARLLKINIQESIQQDWFDAWIMSLTELKDDLSQWRGYVPGKKGGYAIGFNTGKLVDALKKLTRNEMIKGINKIPILTRCWYVEQNKADIAMLYKSMLAKYGSDIKQYQGEKKISPETARSVLATIFPMAMHIKHNAFWQEKESRIIVTVPGCDYSKVKILGGKPRIPLGIPLLGIKLHTLIDRIVVSPHGDKTLLYEQVKWLKNREGADFDIVQSEIPYDPSR